MRDLSHSGPPTVKTVSHWVLYAKTSGGYHLSSEIHNVPGGMRVVLLEDLDNQLVPVTIGLELYSKNETKPAVRVACELVKTSVTCRGDDSAKGAAPGSATYDVQGHSFFGSGTWLTLISVGR